MDGRPGGAVTLSLADGGMSGVEERRGERDETAPQRTGCSAETERERQRERKRERDMGWKRLNTAQGSDSFHALCPSCPYG